ncbi:hypothetical protein [Pseudomonas sp. OA65]|nr:hypothetical protein [Pseudomonas sp. OA65]MBO1536823.1 hypothetical protein [Pseudomonas sp. OA65]
MIEPVENARFDAGLDGMFSLGSHHDVLRIHPGGGSVVHVVGWVFL